MKEQTWKVNWSLAFSDKGRLNPIIRFHMQRAIENFAKNGHPRVVMEWYDWRSRETEYTHLHENQLLHPQVKLFPNIFQDKRSKFIAIPITISSKMYVAHNYMLDFWINGWNRSFKVELNIELNIIPTLSRQNETIKK